MSEDELAKKRGLRPTTNPSKFTELVRWGLLIVIVLISGVAIWSATPVLHVQFENCYAGWTHISLSESTGSKSAGMVDDCLEPNEIGDLLAGVFATLAFLWLFYTVVLQSLELSAQRKELKLTNWIADGQEFALAQQASTMKETAKLTSEQQARKDLDTLVEIIAPQMRVILKCVGLDRDLSADPKVLVLTKGRDLVEAINIVIPMVNTQENYKIADHHLRELFIQHSSHMELLPSRLGAYDKALYSAYHFPLMLSALKRFGAKRKIGLPGPEM